MKPFLLFLMLISVLGIVHLSSTSSTTQAISSALKDSVIESPKPSSRLIAPESDLRPLAPLAPLAPLPNLEPAPLKITPPVSPIPTENKQVKKATTEPDLVVVPEPAGALLISIAGVIGLLRRPNRRHQTQH